MDQLISAAGGNAFDLLGQSLGVKISSEGIVSIRGKSSVLVLVDNRENHIRGEQLASFLRGFPSGQIQSIEIITRPSARYASSGTGGIINIKTKKGAQRGFGANLVSGIRQGKRYNMNNNLGLNWRNDRLYAFANYGYVISSPYNLLKIENTFLKEDGTAGDKAVQTYEAKFRNLTHSIQTGVDFSVGKTFAGLSYSGSFEDHRPRMQYTQTYLTDAAGQPLGRVSGERFRDNYIRRNSVNLNFVQSFAKPGAELSVASDFFHYNLDLNYRISNTFAMTDPAESSTVKFIQKTPNDFKVFSSKADLTLPLSSASTFQVGWRGSFTRMDNAYRFSLFDPAKQDYTPDPARSVHYVFDENILSAYGNFLHTFSETWDMEAGLRVENTVNSSVEKSAGDLLDKNYTRWFPQVLLNYNAGENHAYSFSYSRRFNRPEYLTLIPAYLYTDLLYYTYGNPRQDPEVADNADLSYTFMGKLTANLNLSFLDRMFFTETLPEEENYAVGETYLNRGSQRSVALTVDYSEEVGPWYSLVFSGTLGHMKTKDEQKEYASDGFFFSGQMINRFSLGKGWNAEISGVYNSGQYESIIYYINSYGYLVAGLSKSLFKGKGSIKLQMRDPFYSTVMDYDVKFTRLNQKWVLRQDPRQVGLSFSYNFSSGNQKKSRGRISSNEEEKGRFSQ
ncbi:MAG: TonB-dependent receptor [Leadbetterella sp.]|nr:TonB-dependent receptor [Leadbetterella sp.]